MPSEQGDLTGEGWELLTDAVQAQILRDRGQSAKRTTRIDRLTTRVPADGFRTLTMKAARRRGLSLEAYQRRAIAAVMVYDLDLNWWELLADEPWVTTYAGGLNERRPLAGAAFGPWHIDGMSDPP
jgi:hypothetical protein